MSTLHFIWVCLAATLLFGCDSPNHDKTAALDALGRQHVDKGDFKGAIPIYGEAIKLTPNDGFLYFNRGAAKLHTGDYDGAIADFTEAIRLAPKIRAPSYDARGKAKQFKGDQKGAQEDFYADTQETSDDSDTYVLHAVA